MDWTADIEESIEGTQWVLERRRYCLQQPQHFCFTP
jgi:hypothetical protein